MPALGGFLEVDKPDTRWVLLHLDGPAGLPITAGSQVRISREVYAGGPAEVVALQFMAVGDHFIVVQPYEV